MPAVFVHGNPETAAIWDDLLPYLGGVDVVLLSPPGFGAPVPDGFGATVNEYCEWLAAELARIGGPIDLVGHDWGGAHVLRIAMQRSELIRSWSMDCVGVFDPQYVWHDLAQIWQTPGAGEQQVTQQVSMTTEARALRYESLGMSRQVAGKVSAGYDQAMGRCILAVYRSAAQPAMATWGRELEAAAAKPGLVLVPTEDHFVGGEAMARRSAVRCGAKIAVLQGVGHWWMCQDPKRGAAALTEFWANLA